MPLQILSKVYLARSDVGYSVRSAAVHVWKTLVTNTPRTLAEILPFLMESIIQLLASEGERCRTQITCALAWMPLVHQLPLRFC